MAESELHIRLKAAACRWLWDGGYAAVAEEVKVPAVGIEDVAAAGKWKRQNPRRPAFEREPTVDRFHVVFVECKAMRADFIRDQGRQKQFAFALAERRDTIGHHRRRKPRHASPALGKFDTCLIRPHANLHYLLTPPGLIRVREIPRRWGWLVLESGRVRVVRKPVWHEVSSVACIEGAISRALTASKMRHLGDIRRPFGEPREAPHRLMAQ